jgi:biotin synthase-like enzyme
MAAAFSRDEIAAMLGASSEAEREKVRAAAEAVLLQECGNSVYMRGLVEISNACRCDCFYCGIRKLNRKVHRLYAFARGNFAPCPSLRGDRLWLHGFAIGRAARQGFH